MKKFLFVAVLGALVACNDSSTSTATEDSLKAAKIADSLKNAINNAMDTAAKKVDTATKKMDTAAAKMDTAVKGTK